MQTSAPMLAAVVAGVLALAGLMALWAALQMMIEDFSKRYHRGMHQFRAGEGARQAMLVELRDIVANQASDALLSEPGGEFAEIAQLVNEVTMRQQRSLDALHAGVDAARADSTAALKALAAAEGESQSVVQALEALAKKLKDAAHVAELQVLDAQAASHAADQASWRCADAARVAQDTASRMAALREGLQETSKGIKRLGERTQEIDTVVDGMELLAEQIGVLALNASLEAERAGEHGAGFRLVAKEIQGIARRAGEATQQIAALVKSAQADARSASEAVQRSTAHVVAGGSVAAVSHALLGVLAPLVAGVDSLARVISESCADSQSRLSVASGAAADAVRAASVAQASQAQVGDSLGRVRGQLKLLTPNG
jgi:twitching motility protein PilJ